MQVNRRYTVAVLVLVLVIQPSMAAWRNPTDTSSIGPRHMAALPRVAAQPSGQEHANIGAGLTICGALILSTGFMLYLRHARIASEGGMSGAFEFFGAAICIPVGVGMTGVGIGFLGSGTAKKSVRSK